MSFSVASISPRHTSKNCAPTLGPAFVSSAGAGIRKPFLGKNRVLAGGDRLREVSQYDDCGDGGYRVFCDYGALTVHRTEWYTLMCTDAYVVWCSCERMVFYNIDDLAGDGARLFFFAVCVIIRQSLSR